MIEQYCGFLRETELVYLLAQLSTLYEHLIYELHLFLVFRGVGLEVLCGCLPPTCTVAQVPEGGGVHAPGGVTIGTLLAFPPLPGLLPEHIIPGLSHPGLD